MYLSGLLLRATTSHLICRPLAHHSSGRLPSSLIQTSNLHLNRPRISPLFGIPTAKSDLRRFMMSEPGQDPPNDPPSHDDKKRASDEKEGDSSKSTQKNLKKKRRRETKNSGHTFRNDEHGRDKKKLPHEGSYATEAQRQEFDMSLEGRTPFEGKTSKKKIALFVGFLGTRYGGFQINVHQRTLHAELELALYKAGLISESNYGYPFKYSWSNSARTDKGVHACAQVCSLKVELPSDIDDDNNSNDNEAIRQRIQAFLPEDIKILDIVRTVGSFCAKTQRDRVRYQYMVPSFMFHPEPREVFKKHNIPLTGRLDVAKQPLSAEEVVILQTALKEYRSTKEQREVLQNALSKYVGTHSFHNFTKGIKFGEATANRYIVSFHVQDPIIVDGIEWIPTQVVGQAFLLHQIRKMVSMAMDATRGVVPVDCVTRALSSDTIRVGLAPAQGLFLEFSWYDNYNTRKKDQNPALPDLDLAKEGSARDRWEAFRTNIREHIVKEEEKQGNFIQYLYQQECIFDYEEYYKLNEKVEEGGAASKGESISK